MSLVSLGFTTHGFSHCRYLCFIARIFWQYAHLKPHTPVSQHIRSSNVHQSCLKPVPRSTLPFRHLIQSKEYLEKICTHNRSFPPSSTLRPNHQPQKPKNMLAYIKIRHLKTSVPSSLPLVRNNHSGKSTLEEKLVRLHTNIALYSKHFLHTSSSWQSPQSRMRLRLQRSSRGI